MRCYRFTIRIGRWVFAFGLVRVEVGSTAIPFVLK